MDAPALDTRDEYQIRHAAADHDVRDVFALIWRWREQLFVGADPRNLQAFTREMVGLVRAAREGRR